MRSQKIKRGRMSSYPNWRGIKKHHRRNKLILSIFLLIIISSVGLLIWQNKYLVIKQITINRDNQQDNTDYLVSEQEIQNLIQQTMSDKFLMIFRKNTLLTLRKRGVEEKLLNDSRIQSVKIAKRWPDQLIVSFSENKPVVRLTIFGDKDYYLASTGQLILLASDILRHFNKPSIIDKTYLNWSDLRLSKAVKIALNLLQGQVGLNGLIHFKNAEISQNQGVLEVKAVTDEGWLAYFMPREDIDQQITNLKLTLENQLSDPEKRKGLEYIDLRFGNRIYYK